MINETIEYGTKHQQNQSRTERRIQESSREFWSFVFLYSNNSILETKFEERERERGEKEILETNPIR